MAKKPVYQPWSKMRRGGDFVKPLDIRLTHEEITAGKKILRSNTKTDNVIAIFTYATGNKCLPETWWVEFYEQLKLKYQDFDIIEILPKEHISALPPSLITAPISARPRR